MFERGGSNLSGGPIRKGSIDFGGHIKKSAYKV